jgi:glycosyltransferase involved in cell wall biosynthesis
MSYPASDHQSQPLEASFVSLIMTVFNREKYLGAAIASVLSQTYTNFQLIIWDDGSSDQSLNIATDYAQQDARIRLIAADHQGRVLSLKQAHDMVAGVYVGWIDSDDLLAPTALTATAALLDTHPNVGMVYTQYQTIDAENNIGGLGRRCQIPYSELQMLVDFMTFHFRLIRPSVYDQVGGVDLSFPCAIDYDLCLRLSEVTEFYYLEEPLYFYREHTESISQGQSSEQQYHARRAVENALQRRGLSDVYKLVIKPPSRFELYRKEDID